MDKISVEVFNLHAGHPEVAAEEWCKPLVCRLLDGTVYHDGPREIKDSYRGPGAETETGTINLTWSGRGEEVGRYLKTYQAPRITELATLGLACILVQYRASQEITEVMNMGERADYWLGDRQWVIEISGQQSGSLSNLTEEKRQQLLKNPFEKDGFVCVANYDARQARLWFYRFGA